MKTLEEIFAEGCSDKAALHGYHTTYEKLMGPVRLKPIRLLELGFLGGDSLEAWAKYFPHPQARIAGLDLLDRLYRPTDNRININFGDASRRDVLESLGTQWDVVIDDASHLSSNQIEAFSVLWPRVNPGGVYVIEDLHTINSPVHCDHPFTIINYMAKVACDMQDPRGATGSARYNPEHRWSDIDSIELRKGLAVIRKL